MREGTITIVSLIICYFLSVTLVLTNLGVEADSLWLANVNAINMSEILKGLTHICYPMETNADENMVFSSLKGPFYYSVLAFIILLGAIVIFLAVRHYSGIWTLLLALIGTMFFLSAALLMRFVGKIRYVLETDGIKLNDSMTTRHSMISVFTPYIKIIEFYKARNVLIGYGASTDCVVIRFINKYGNKDTLALSPKNKQLFISELTKRTGIPVSPNPRSKTKGRNA